MLETQSVVQILHRIRTEETDYKNVFLQPDHIPSKNELPLPYTVAGLTVLWLFVKTLSKHLSPELRIFYDVSQDTYM